MTDYPEIEICSECRDNTIFEYNDETGEWLSVCCSASPISPDVELDDDFDPLADYNMEE